MVLFVCYSGAFGGAERLALGYVTALGERACLACPEGKLADAARSAGIRVFRLRARSLHVRLSTRERLLATARLAAHAREVSGLVRSLQPAVVVAWGMRPALACVGAGLGRRARNRPRLRRASAPRLVFQHNDFVPGGIAGLAVRAAARRADLVLALSQSSAADLDADAGLGRRLKVIYPGIDTDSFDHGSAPAAPPEILVLGALVDWKRADLALEALAVVRQRHPEVGLRLVGATLERGHAVAERLRQRAAREDLAGAVEFVGGVDDPRPALQRATCLLHCAEREPFGLAVLEALASGRPVVVPAAAGPAEIVDSSCALPYRPGDANEAAAAILTLLSDPERAASMGAAGRQRARKFAHAEAERGFVNAVTALIAQPAPRARERPRPSELAIVTVTHNSAAELATLLGSIDRHLSGARVVVVDNASSDDTLVTARQWSGAATVLELDSNLGFGRACNLGLGEVKQPIALLLNPDVELIDDSLLELARELRRPGAPERLLAPLVLRADGTRQDSVHPRPASLADLTRSLVPPAALPGRAGLPLAPWRTARPRRVGWAVGCALAARTETLHRLGPFDERIFMYAEDLDLGLRASAAGVQTWFWPAARVIHRGAHATAAAFGGEPFDLLARARREAVQRRLGPGHARLDDAAQAVTFASRATLKRFAGRPAKRESRQRLALARARSGALERRRAS